MVDVKGLEILGAIPAHRGTIGIVLSLVLMLIGFIACIVLYVQDDRDGTFLAALVLGWMGAVLLGAALEARHPAYTIARMGSEVSYTEFSSAYTVLEQYDNIYFIEPKRTEE